MLEKKLLVFVLAASLIETGIRIAICVLREKRNVTLSEERDLSVQGIVPFVQRSRP